MKKPKCKKCGAAFTSVMLHRTKPKGQPDAGWMCASCLEKNGTPISPDIQKEEQDIMKALQEVFNPYEKRK